MMASVGGRRARARASQSGSVSDSGSSASAPVCAALGFTRSYRVPPHGRLVELDAQPRPDWHVKQAGGVRANRLGKHEVAALRGPVQQVIRELHEGSAADARHDVQIGKQADADVHVCGVNQRLRASASSTTVRVRSMPPASTTSGSVNVTGIGVDRRQQLGLGAGHLAARDAHARGRPQRGQAAQIGRGEGFLKPQDVELVEALGDRRAPTGSSDGVTSPAMHQPWFRSTRMAMSGPTASRVAATAATPSSRRRGSMPVFDARKPSARRRNAASARSSGGSSTPQEA